MLVSRSPMTAALVRSRRRRFAGCFATRRILNNRNTATVCLTGDQGGESDREAGDRARRENSLDLIRTLVELRDDPSVQPGVRAFCANSILDRAIGKVKEFVDADPERVDMVQALMTALQMGGTLRTTRRLTLDVDEFDG